MRIGRQKRLKLSDIAVLGPIFYISKVAGLLPVCYNLGPLSKKNIICSKIKENPFSLSMFGMSLSLIHLVNQLWTSYKVLEFCIKTAMEYKVTCLSGNHCTIYAVFISHISISLFTLLSMMTHCRGSVKCFNSAYYLLQQRHPSYSRLPLASFSIIGFMALVALRLLLTYLMNTWSYPLFYYGYYMSYFVPFVILNLIGTLALVAENAYRQVNHDLEVLLQEQCKPKHCLNQIRQLTEIHNNITDFVNEISSCFGLDILLGVLDCFLQLVLFLYLTIWTLFVQGLFSNWLAPYWSGAFEMTTIFLKIVYICYRCHKTSQYINIFVMERNSRPISITALNLFSLNMDLIFKIIGIVSTYFIVLIQFQISGGKQTFTPNKIIDSKDCNEWPCLGG